MQTNNVIIIFDLDETILTVNSFHKFIEYEFKQSSLIFKFKILNAIILRKLRVITARKLKNRILARHKLKDKKELEEYFYNFYKTLKDYYDRDIIAVIDNYVKKNFDVIIITGAFYDYSIFIAKELNVKELVATNLKYDDKYFTGEIDGMEMLANQKKEYILHSKYKDRKVIFYSNSFLDKPLLDYSYKSYLVSLKSQKNKIRFYRTNVETKT